MPFLSSAVSLPTPKEAGQTLSNDQTTKANAPQVPRFSEPVATALADPNCTPCAPVKMNTPRTQRREHKKFVEKLLDPWYQDVRGGTRQDSHGRVVRPVAPSHVLRENDRLPASPVVFPQHAVRPAHSTSSVRHHSDFSSGSEQHSVQPGHGVSTPLTSARIGALSVIDATMRETSPYAHGQRYDAEVNAEYVTQRPLGGQGMSILAMRKIEHERANITLARIAMKREQELNEIAAQKVAFEAQRGITDDSIATEKALRQRTHTQILHHGAVSHHNVHEETAVAQKRLHDKHLTAEQHAHEQRLMLAQREHEQRLDTERKAFERAQTQHNNEVTRKKEHVQSIVAYQNIERDMMNNNHHSGQMPPEPFQMPPGQMPQHPLGVHARPHQVPMLNL